MTTRLSRHRRARTPPPQIPIRFPLRFGKRPRGLNSAGIWDPAALDTVQGWLVERRRDPDRDLVPPEDWYRLTPIPLPTDLRFWNDTTASPGVSYLYRVRANHLSKDAIEAATIGPLRTERGATGWLATIPEVAVLIHPGGTREVSLSVSGGAPRLSGVDLETEFASPLVLSVTPTSLPVPGIARLLLHVGTEAEPGTYAVAVVVEDETTHAKVPLIVEVFPSTRSIDRDFIVRQPTSISLSSDSDLRDQRMSVRGQLGIVRSLAKATDLRVDINLPDGTPLSATGVVAPTGQFTAEFAVPPHHEPGREWRIRATWPGSLDAVGGSSLPFRLPVYTPQDGTKDAEDTPPDLGEVIAVIGHASSAEIQKRFSDLAERIFKRLLRDRLLAAAENFFGTNVSLASIVPTTSSNAVLMDTILNKLQTKSYVLLYLLGEAEEKENGSEFILSQSERISGATLAELIQAVTIAGATPLLIMDSPYAGNFMESLSAINSGAFIFSCQPGFFPKKMAHGSFTLLYQSQLSSAQSQYPDGCEPRGFGSALKSVEVNLIALSPDAMEVQEPKQVRALDVPYFSLAIGSAFTPPRCLIRDEHPPLFLSPTMSTRKLNEVGDEVELQATVEDPPLDLEVTVWAELFNKSGWTTTVNMPQDSGSDRNYKGTVRIFFRGLTIIVFHARDENLLETTKISSVYIAPEELNAKDLLLIISLSRRNPISENGDLGKLLFTAATIWKDQ